MASIAVADHAGACFGVQRALDLVRKVAARATTPVVTLGPLIHNPQVVAELEGIGVTVSEKVPTDVHTTLVLRTHGVLPEVERVARERGLEVVDATCPYVKRVHRSAERLRAEGYRVLVVGESGHPEVEAILGHAPGAVAIGCAADLDKLQLGGRVGVVVQTTQTKDRLDEVVDALTCRVDEVCVINTICEATTERQQAARALAARSDIMVVIGGRNSANTTRLAELCAQNCPGTYHVETAAELSASWFDGVERIGVTAGASTPTSQIDELVSAIRKLVDSGT